MPTFLTSTPLIAVSLQLGIGRDRGLPSIGPLLSSDAALNMRRNMNEIINLIVEFSPDLALFVGLMLIILGGVIAGISPAIPHSFRNSWIGFGVYFAAVIATALFLFYPGTELIKAFGVHQYLEQLEVNNG